MLMHLTFMFAMIFTMPIGLYFDKFPEKIPASLQFIYQNPADLWQWSVMIVSTFWVVFIVGFFCLIVGMTNLRIWAEWPCFCLGGFVMPFRAYLALA